MGIIAYFIPFLFMFAAMIVLQREPAGPEVMRVPGGKPVAIALAATGFLVTAVSIVLACIPPDDEPNKMLAVVKVVGSSAILVGVGAVVYLLGRRRAGPAEHVRLADTTDMAKRTLALVFVVHAAAAFAGQRAPSPQSPAAPRTMRLDYYHTGNAKEERFSVDRVVLEPLPWPGNPARPLDATNRGKYFFEVVDAASGAVLYSRGFSSIYGEWETTGEAKEVDRTFSESLRFPAPATPVRIVVKKRDARNVFRDVWSTTIDPADKFVAARRRSRCRSADQAARERRSRQQAGPADPRRRLHRARARRSSSATRGG